MKRVNFDEELYLRLLLYGMPGSTKTRTACTAALDDRSYPCLHLNAKGNVLSIREYERKPDVIDMETMKDFNDPYNWLVRGQPEDHPFALKYELNPPYKCVIIDSITETQRMSFNDQVGHVGPGDMPSRVNRQHFGNTLSQMINLSKLYFSLPKIHVIMTSLERRDLNEATGAIDSSPLLWGQSNSEVGGYAYAVGRMIHRASLPTHQLKVLEAVADKEEGTEFVSVALWRPSGSYVAKDQYGVLGEYMINPTITKILDAIYKE